MITKVRNLSRAFEYEANLEQDVNNTTDLTFAFFAGEAFLGDSLSDISAGTVSVPDAPWAVWLDVSVVSAPVVTAGVLASIPTTDSIVLYMGSTSGGAILQSTIVDQRSFNTGRRGLSINVPSFVLTNDPEASPINTYWVMRSRMATWNDIEGDWDPSSGGASTGASASSERQTANLVMDEASGPIRAIGVSQADYTISGTPTFGEVGPTFLKGNAVGAMGFDGSTDFIRSIVNTFSASATGVYWGWFFATTAGSGNNRIAVAQSNAAGSVTGEWGVSAADEVFVQMVTTAGTYRLEIDTPKIVHDTWNFVVIVQRADGNGAQIYWNGVLYNKDTSNTTETLSGTANRDNWWITVWNAVGRQGGYAARSDTGASFKFEGRLFDLGLAVPLVAQFPLLWPDANVNKLMRCAGF